MKKQLNIKALAKGMRVEDKAKLLFADRNKKAETSGREGLLTSEEEKALIDDAQDLHQINELNRLNRLYNLASFIFLDIQTAYLHFRLAEGRLLTIITGVVLVGESSDVLSRTIYDLAVKGCSEKQLEEKKFQEEVDEKAAELRKEYKVSGLSKVYDYFEPSLGGGSYFSTKPKAEVSQPNKLLQKAFMRTLEEIKAYEKQMFQWQYIESKADIDLLGGRERKIIDGFSKEVDDFIDLDGYLGLIKMYAEFSDKGLLKVKQLEEPKFIDAVKDMKKATSLRKKEKEKARIEMDNIETRQSN